MLTDDQKKPTNIDLDMKQRMLHIDWKDGHRSTYTFDKLRSICPCAMCKEVRSNADPLRVLSADQATVSADLRPVGPVELVGNYALQFLWADGHNTGIYTFGFLREHG